MLNSKLWIQIQEQPALRSFHYRDFRFLWIGAQFGTMGAWMQRLTVSWLVLVLTDSPLFLGITLALSMAPSFFLGSVSGAIVDRVNRKHLLITVRCIRAVLTFSLALMVITNSINIFWLMGTVFIFGILETFPTIQTVIYDVVGEKDALNGLSLESFGNDAVGIVGALLGGALIETLGIGAAFLAASSSYLLGIVIITLMRYTPVEREDTRKTVFRDLADGLRFLFSNQALATLLILATIFEIFGFGAISMLPVFADDEVFGVGAFGLGIMTSAISLGCVSRAIALASLPNLRHRGWILLAVMLFAGLLIVGFSQLGIFVIFCLILIGVGITAGTFDTMEIILLQDNVPNEMRGRAIGAWIQAIGIGPIGPLIMDYLAEQIGVQYAVGIGGIILTFVAVLVIAWMPKVRALQ